MFRQVGRDDLAQLLPLVVQFYQHFKYAVDPEVKRAALLALLDKPVLGRIWMICVDEKPVGYMILVFSFSLESNGDTACIDEFYIEPAARGHGLGAAALRFAEDTCRAMGMTALHLESEDTNPRATALYLRHGFVDLGRRLLKERLQDAGGGPKGGRF